MKLKFRLISVLLSMVLILTLMPMMTFADDPTVNWSVLMNGRTVTGIKYTMDPDNQDNNTFVRGRDDYWFDPNDEEYYFFYPGDTIEVSTNNGSILLIFNDDDDGYNEWWEDTEGRRIDFGTVDSPSIDQSKLMENLNDGENLIDVYFAGKSCKKTIWIKSDSDPVTKLEFIPAGDEAAIRDRFTVSQSDIYDFDFEIGDVLKVTKSKGTTAYTAVEEQDEKEGYYYIVFRDNNGTGSELPDDYGWPEMNRDSEGVWQPGTHNLIISYGGRSCTYPVTVTANSVATVQYTPVKANYNETDIIAAALYSPEGNFVGYYLDPVAGDRVVISDSNGTETTYTYNGNDFRDTSGNELEGDEPVLVYEDDEINSTGTYPFEIRYEGRIGHFDITVNRWDASAANEAKSLKAAKEQALRDIDTAYTGIDTSLYRQAEQDKLYELYCNAQDEVEKASTKSEVNEVVSALKVSFGKIKTDSQLTAEEQEAKRIRELERLDWEGTRGAISAAKSVKAKAGKKKVTVSWKKLDKKKLKKFDKVEIQICTNKSFAKANTPRIEVKKTKKSATIRGLVKNQTYYIRVRNVKGSGSGKIVSAWSKAKKVKIK